MALQSSFTLFGPNTWTSVQITKDWSFTFVQINPLLLHDVLLGIFLTHFHSNFLLEGLHLSFKLRNPAHLLTSENDFLDEDHWFDKLGEVESGDSVGEMEVESERCQFSFIIFDDALENADVERDMCSIDWQENRVVSAVDIDKFRFQILWKFVFALIAFNFADIDSLLFFEISSKILVHSFLQFFKFFLFENSLMVIPFFLIFHLFIGLLHNFSPATLNNLPAGRSF